MVRSIVAGFLILSTAVFQNWAAAQSHFSSCLTGEGNIFNATIIVPSESRPTLNGFPLPDKSEIAVFATDSGYQDLCVGVMRVTDSSGFITLWGDDPITPERDGLNEGADFVFKAWDAARDVEYPSHVIVSSIPSSSKRYSHDATFVLSELSVFSAFSGLDAVDDAVSVAEDSVVTVDVLQNDVSTEQGPLSVYQFGQPKHGTASKTADGHIEYRPGANFHGLDSLTYVVSGRSGSLGQGTLHIDVVSVNDPPVIVSSPPVGASVNIPYFFDIVGYDVENDPLVFSVEQLPTWMTLRSDGGRIAQLTGSPAIQDVGLFDIHIVLSDGADSTRLSFSLTVRNGANHVPVALDDAITVPEDSSITFRILANDSDPDGEVLTLGDVSAVQNGTLVRLDDGRLTFQPAANFNGVVSFDYSVLDPSGASAQASVQITVTPVNDPPVFSSQPVVQEIQTGQEYTYSLAATDVDGNALTFSLLARPTWLTLTPGDAGKAVLRGTPIGSAVGSHTVSIQVTDGSSVTLQTFEIRVVEQPAPTLPPLTVVPAAPMILTEENISEYSRSPSLNWSAVPDAERYHFQLSLGLAPDYLNPVIEDSMLVENSIAIQGLDAGTWYSWRIRAANSAGFSDWSESMSFITSGNLSPTDPDNAKKPVAEDATVPTAIELLQNYPNPFNPETTIVFELPSQLHVLIDVFDLLGQHIITLVSETLDAGRHEVKWFAGQLPSGVYIYRLRAGDTVRSRTLSLIK